MANVLRNQFSFFFRTVLYFLLLFAVWRVVFLIVNHSEEAASFIQIAPAFLYGLRIDLSAIGYILLPVFPLSIIFAFSSASVLSRIVTYYFRSIALLATTVLLGNVVIYHFWGTMLNYRALTYLTDPKEAVASVSTVQLILLLACLFLSGLLALIGVRKIIPATFPPSGDEKKKLLPTYLLLAGIIFLSIRGGWQQLPMNESLVYYSERSELNSAAVNPLWHLTYDTRMALTENHNPFQTLDPASAKALVDQLTVPRGQQVTKIIESSQPNIVLIVLESFTADIIGALGGEKNVTPVLDSLIQQGFLFENIYSSGFRTDQGIVSLINGWPATPFHSIMRSVDKSRQLPSFSRVLSAKGYQTSFYYGGESNFSNLKSYVLDQGFNQLVDGNNFEDEESRGKWGVHDGVVLQKNVADLKAVRQPFLSVVLTLSNHEPFDVPGEKRFQGNDAPSKFRNAAAYTDAALGAYFAEASRHSWYKNTLFVLVADHAHELPLHRNVLYPSGRHIPLLFVGPALSDSVKGKRCNTYGGHHDLAKTLLHQLDYPANEFNWSKDLLDSAAASYAYLPHENYLLWNTEKGWFIWMIERKTITERAQGFSITDNDLEALRARAYMQMHYDAYLKY